MSPTRARARLRTAEAATWLIVGRGLRRFLPMRRWTRVLGRPGPPTAVPVPGRALAGRDRDVAAALTAATRRLPIAVTCLDQAVAGRWMLRLRGDRPVVVCGLSSIDPAAGSHAWLVSGAGAVVTGGAVMGEFSAVTEFR